MQVLGENVNINAYFSPQGGIVGLGSHFDIQEIFILHIAGSKTLAASSRSLSKPDQEG